MSVVTSLGFSITSSWDGSGARAARRDLNRLTSDVSSNNAQIKTAASSLFSVSTALLSLGPALIPIGIATVGVAGGLTAMGVAAGGALGIYGAAMKGAIARTMEMAAAHKQLSPIQQTFIANVKGIKTAWASFIASTGDTTLVAASAALAGLTSGIGRLGPVVKAVAPIVNQVAFAFQAWMQGNGFKGFVDLLISQGVPALQNLVNAGRSVVSVLGAGFRAFLPMGVQLSAVLARGAASLKLWSSGGGFERFVALVQQVAPQVKEFFTTLFAAISNVSRAMTGLGPIALGLATNLLRIVAAMPPWMIQAIVVAILAIRTAMLAWAVASAIATAAQIALMIASGPFFLLLVGAALTIGLVIAAIVALGVAIYFLVTRWNTVKSALVASWNATWNALKTAASAVWNAIKVAWHAVCTAIVTAWRASGAALKAAWSATWNGIKAAASAVWNAIKSAASAFFSALRSKVSSALSSIRSAFSSGMNAIKSIVSSAFSALKSAISSRISAIISVVRSIPGKIKGALGNLGGLLVSAGKAIIAGLVRGIKAGAGAVVSAVKGVLSAARKLLPFSPAKEGPFSGKGWTLHSGRSLMQGFADGVDKGAPQAIRSTSRAMGSIGDFTAPASATHVGAAAGGSHGGGGGGNITINITGVNLSSRAELENAVVRAVSEAKRKKRL